MRHWTRELTAAACIAVFSFPATADTIFGVDAGVGLWLAGPDGNIGGTAVDVEALGLSRETNAFVHVALEHPIPLWPNLMLQHTRLRSSGTGTLSRQFELDDVVFSTGETVSTDLDLSHTDAVMYYELLDNVLSLDLGWTLRVFSGHARVANRGRALSENVDIDAVIPMVYGRALLELPGGFAVNAQANFIGYSGNSLQDLSAHVAYAFESAVDVGVEVGYRRFALELDDDARTDVSLSGPYVAVAAHF